MNRESKNRALARRNKTNAKRAATRGELLRCCARDTDRRPPPQAGLFVACRTCGAVLCWDGAAWFYDPASDTEILRRMVAARETV